MRALVTNDDGVDSPGIHALARVAAEAGLETVIAAPSWDSSGAAASLTAVEREGRFIIDERYVADLPDVRVFAAEAAPAFIVRAALAVSLDVRSASAACHWDTAVIVARVALRWLLDSATPLVLNVNAPNCPPDELRGIRSTRLAAFGAVQTIVTEQGAGYVKLAYDEIAEDLVAGTDAAALAACTASVTSLHAVCEEVEAGLPEAFELAVR